MDNTLRHNKNISCIYVIAACADSDDKNSFIMQTSGTGRLINNNSMYGLRSFFVPNQLGIYHRYIFLRAVIILDYGSCSLLNYHAYFSPCSPCMLAAFSDSSVTMCSCHSEFAYRYLLPGSGNGTSTWYQRYWYCICTGINCVDERLQ